MSVTRVTAIIPAYNEEVTLGRVISTLKESSLFDEILVVSDGSTDQTVEVATQAGIRVIAQKKNCGKGETMIVGVENTSAQIIVFFDADLLGLTVRHIEQLVLPVLKGEKAMNVGMRDRGWFWTRFAQHLPLISGERALRREIFEGVPPKMMKGFMVESALNYYCRTRKLVYGSVILHGLSIRRKYQKVGWVKGMIGYLKMTSQIIKSIFLVRFARLFGLF
ncbi:hypothetical protein A2239_03300 [Candidatus Uhrbacteria bacterium RIFOXYA2_FULL_40_9]|nr:MAG: Glycosyl transferase family 2 [Candidatus Uhrbacteria bacterium GW2011_GWF2_40_263]OGL94308.1 MAG: hypothetical protein A2239_03300 [Candidatus Uhrbacteria bacterium RIFOXYA2_FULL_40_9]OGL96529.1 MAG: hypothetical protein A2332_00945 [Candidatus Uhrbacteria bacterium RIFOXYB2_FULL_41_18]HBK35056.1 glycosyl transferase family 2 [Candidatus Uhrbacteria bacterium]HCB55600.1 glycosyl transferase family 2 [Candidatus Uhrbacteria bacterium]